MLKHSLKITRWDWVVSTLLAFLWIGQTQIREHFYSLHCLSTEAPCLRGEVNAFDAWAIDQRDETAHNVSFITQNFSAYFAAGVPFVLALTRSFTWPVAFAEWTLTLQAILLNGNVMEIVRGVVQRPRPHVYRQPMIDGTQPSHYTSFYSGHTSFAAVCMMWVFLFFRDRGFSRNKLYALGFVSLSMVVATGVFRVLGGRHFPTDVLVGAVVGATISYGVREMHQSGSYFFKRLRQLFPSRARGSI